MGWLGNLYCAPALTGGGPRGLYLTEQEQFGFHNHFRQPL